MWEGSEKSHMATESKSGCGGTFGFIVLMVLLLWVVEPLWHSKLRYAIQYDVPFSSITTAKKPHDCDAMTAPIGDKDCSYEPDVATVRTGISAEGKPIVSFDEGKRWTLDDSVPPTKPSVTVSWKKVDGRNSITDRDIFFGIALLVLWGGSFLERQEKGQRDRATTLERLERECTTLLESLKEGLERLEAEQRKMGRQQVRDAIALEGIVANMPASDKVPGDDSEMEVSAEFADVQHRLEKTEASIHEKHGAPVARPDGLF